jgi:hypothetical protein
MQALVVYESFFGNTAAVARAIAEGIGAGASAMTTDDATSEVVSNADLVVVGAPVLGFRLPTDDIRAGLLRETGAPTPPDTSHRSMRSWLEGLPAGHAGVAAFSGFTGVAVASSRALNNFACSNERLVRISPGVEVS